MKKRFFIALFMFLIPLLCLSASAAEAGETRALFIYNGKFAPPFGSLGQTPRADAEAMHASLSLLGLRQSSFASPESLYALKDSIERAFAGATHRDTSYFYFSGHGDQRDGEPCLVLSDGIDNVFVGANALERVLRRIPGRKVIIIDACHSGGLMGKSRSVKDEALFLDDLAAPFRRGNYTVISAAGFYEFAWSDYPYSDFTGAFARAVGALGGEAVADMDGDGSITLDELRKTLRAATLGATMQTYPENGANPLFTYADDRFRPQVTHFSVDEKTLDYGAENALTLRFTLSKASNINLRLYTADAYGAAYLLKEETASFEGGSHVHTFKLPADLASGDYIFRLASGGGSYSHVLNVLDPVPPAIRLTVRNPLLEADGAKEMDIRLGFDTSCALSLRVLDGNGKTLRVLADKENARPLHNPTASRPLHYNQYFWDGRDESGALVPAGDYMLKAEGTAAGKSVGKTLAVQVRRPGAKVHIDAPDIYDIESGRFPIDLNVNVAGAVRLHIRGANGVEYALLERETIGRDVHRLVWNGVDANGYTLPSGEYAVRATFTANSERIIVDHPFTIQGDNRIVGRAAVDTSVIYGETQNINITLRKTGTLGIYLLDAKGSIVTTVLSSRTLRRGAHTIRWRVKTPQGIRPGVYQYVFLAESGNIVSPPLTRRIIIAR